MDGSDVSMVIGVLLGVVVSFVISRWWNKRKKEQERRHGIDVSLSKQIFPDTANRHKKSKRKKR